jgi:uncharacterized sulfatase
MKRKQLLRGLGAISLGTVLASSLKISTSAAQSTPRKANILFLMVDELRFPMHLPPGIKDYRKFLSTYMPNLWRVWQKSVSFNNHHTAATACTPARACLFTGLYAHQHFQLITLAPNQQLQGTGLGPQLPTEYPNLGRGLRESGYQTWYFGKWHLSFSGVRPGLSQRGVSPANLTNFQGADYLNDYGYNGGSFPDPEGAGPLTGEEADPQIVEGFVTWSRTVRPKLRDPWCTVVSLVNPHDAQFWWDGPIDDPTRSTQKDGTGSEVVPAPLPIPTVYPGPPPNWEARPQIDEPAIISDFTQAQDVINGGIGNRPNNQTFTTAPIDPPIQADNAPQSYTIAPYDYSAKCLDYYLYLMKKVDVEIGKVLREIEGTDTIVVFTSDHGEYAASHGLRGKGVSAYRESTQVPLFVYDPLAQYTKAPEIPRQGLTSSVDVFRLVMTIANQGSTGWLQQNITYRALYGGRHDLFAMLQQPKTPGRAFILHTCDEPIPNSTPQFHVIGYRTEAEVLAFYTSWNERSGTIARGEATKSQYFDLRQGDNDLELNDTTGSARSKQALAELQRLITTELRKPMPSALEAIKQQMVDNRYNYLNSRLYDALPSLLFNAVNW